MSSAFSDYSPPSYTTSAFATDNESREGIEARRLQAHYEAQRHSSFPTSVTLNGVQVPIFKYDELERLNWNILKTKALNLKDTIISTRSGFFEHYADLTLRTTNAEQVVAWFIAVQVTICNALGYEFDASSSARLPTRTSRTARRHPTHRAARRPAGRKRM